MKQLLLDLSPAPAARFDNFVAGRNAELLHEIQSAVTTPTAERMFYLWGDTGSGRTHLLYAAVLAAREHGLRTAYVDCGQLFAPEDELGELDCVALDNVDQLDAAGQIIAFSIYNRLKERGAMLVSSGPCPPSQLPLLKDLVTRLSWGMIYQIQPLTDADKIAALQMHAAGRGFTLPREAGDYLLNHWRRDLPSLLSVLDELDRLSLETHRHISIPLLREALQHNLRTQNFTLF